MKILINKQISSDPCNQRMTVTKKQLFGDKVIGEVVYDKFADNGYERDLEGSFFLYTTDDGYGPCIMPAGTSQDFNSACDMLLEKLGIMEMGKI